MKPYICLVAALVLFNAIPGDANLKSIGGPCANNLDCLDYETVGGVDFHLYCHDYSTGSSKCEACDNSQVCDEYFTAADAVDDSLYKFSCACKKCMDGYYLVDHDCLPCGPLCETCDDADTCSSCKGSLVLSVINGDCGCVTGASIHADADGNLSCQCENDLCAAFDTDDCSCTSCFDGYYLDNGECLECDKTCLKCSGDAVTCDAGECADGLTQNADNTCGCGTDEVVVYDAGAFSCENCSSGGIQEVIECEGECPSCHECDTTAGVCKLTAGALCNEGNGYCTLEGTCKSKVACTATSPGCSQMCSFTQLEDGSIQESHCMWTKALSNGVPAGTQVCKDAAACNGGSNCSCNKPKLLRRF